MNKFLKLFNYLCLFILLSLPVQAQQYMTDIVLTSPDAIWLDARSQSSLNDAIIAIGADNRTIAIPTEQTVATLTVPANATLMFTGEGAIANSGQLTFQTTHIYAATGYQIFQGAGDIDFADGTIVRSSWFSSLATALLRTLDDNVTLLIDQAETLTTSRAVGNGVHLRVETPYIITANAGVTLSNIHSVEAGNFQIFAGAGDFDFTDGTRLDADWFENLRDALNRVESERVSITLSDESITINTTVEENEILDFATSGGSVTISGGVTLTIDSPENILVSGGQEIFLGNGSVSFSYGGINYPQWWDEDCGELGHECAAAVQSAIYSYASSGNGGTVYAVAGDYLTDSEMDIGVNYLTIKGDGSGTRFYTAENISFFDTNAATVAPFELFYNITIEDLKLECTYNGGRDKYDIVLHSVYHPVVERVQILGLGQGSSNYTDLWGIESKDEVLSGGSPGLNHQIKDCWLRNASVLMNVTDSQILGGHIWGHSRQFSIKFARGSNEANGVNVITSPHTAGIVIEGNQCKIVSCHIDGSNDGVTQTGLGVYITGSYNMLVANHIGRNQKGGVHIYGGKFNCLTTNQFTSNNWGDTANQYDLKVESSAVSSAAYNSAIDNKFVNSQGLANLIDAIIEVDGGAGIDFNRYYINIVQGDSYNDPPFTILGTNNYVQGNYGFVTSAAGVATIPNGSTSVVVAHGADFTPNADDTFITPYNFLGNSTKWWVSAPGALTFTINVDVDPGATGAQFGWNVKQWDD